MIVLSRRYFESRDLGHAIRSLSYFDDADDESELRLLVPIRWQQVNEDLLSWFESLLPA